MSDLDPDQLRTTDAAHLIHPLNDVRLAENSRIWIRGHGSLLVDQNGHEFLDAISGMWNVVVGHGRTELADAAAQQMTQLAFASGYAGSSNVPAIRLAARLAELCYDTINHFYFTTGGAEANESAFKTARYYWRLRGKPDKWRIISRTFGFHGTTMAAMAATGIPAYKTMFGPMVDGFSHIASPYPYRFESPADTPPDDPRTPGQIAADLLEAEILRLGPDNVAAFIGEPVQGAGGVIVPPDDYWPRIRQICDRHDVLLISDEVMNGFGRNADWFALTRYGVQPDMITFAKALTSGYLPLGGLGLSDDIAAAIQQGQGPQAWTHSYTYSAHPTACAVALANLDIIEREDLIARAAQQGERLLAGLRTLESHPHVGEVRGLGLMAAVELVADKSTKATFDPADQIGARVHLATQRLDSDRRGMFTRLRGDCYLFGPPFVTTDDQIDEMVDNLTDAITQVLGN